MLDRRWVHALVLVGALMISVDGVAGAETKYPDWKSQWAPVDAPGVGGGNFDPTKPAGRGQQVPLTDEYQKVLQNSLGDRANGGFGNDPTAQCYAAGMPRMITYQAQEYVITPDVTYILLGGDDNLRRIFTDGRDWPSNIEPTYQGYSIGHWIDEDGDGAYDMLEIETRGSFKGPRAYDPTGLPLDFDNESTFKERLFTDRTDPSLLHDTITVIDHALTRPWTVNKTFRRNPDPLPDWPEDYCHVTNYRLVLGNESYRLDEEGILMPTRKDHPPTDLRYFKPAPK